LTTAQHEALRQAQQEAAQEAFRPNSGDGPVTHYIGPGGIRYDKVNPHNPERPALTRGEGLALSLSVGLSALRQAGLVTQDPYFGVPPRLRARRIRAYLAEFVVRNPQVAQFWWGPERGEVFH